ncbi:helix-turn-helix domain-containing protein [Paenibacillus hexagrammi]|uniref:Helix-turn-helix domain-containing protein n=1 Tax=Paenibacillus hexagrammi TaxID=2908839 RepID=A0ABY3SL87_9BACL|nr:helix-turn-helix domain-containing protein [Paenibacillus sp. YPD9-1]UJF33880.1 helix-turn-helix domain-containing protein [Paenibacillus sp. YPD9-1]
MYMFDLAKKEFAITEAITISELVKNLPEIENNKLPFLIMALANYIEKTSFHNPNSLLQDVQRCLTEQDPHRALQRMLVHMVTVGTSEDVLNVRMYSTGEVARFFGVSVATVNNWVNQGRFHGVEKGERFKQVRIPENAVYSSPTGVQSTVAEAAEAYACEQSRLNRTQPMTDAEELAELVNAVVHFEKKYGGTYEKTLGIKAKPTPDEARDAQQWEGLLRSIEVRGANT